MPPLKAQQGAAAGVCMRGAERSEGHGWGVPCSAGLVGAAGVAVVLCVLLCCVCS